MSAPTGPSALVTLADVKTHLNIPDDNTTQDVELQGFLSAATVYIQNTVGPILPTQFVEVHSGGGRVVALNNPPVLQIDSVIEYVGPVAYPLTAFTLGGPAGQFSYSLDDPQSGVLCRRYNGGLSGRFAGGFRNIQVTYWAGQATVPGDIRMAVLQDIAGMYQPSQLGPGSSMFPNAMGGQNTPNPINMFPRVAAILSAPSKRTPSIA